MYKRRKKCCVVIRLPEFESSRERSRGWGWGIEGVILSSSASAAVCISILHLCVHVAGWLDAGGCWRQLALQQGSENLVFANSLQPLSSSLKFTSSSPSQQQPSRHPGNGPARLEIDWRMQFKVFFFFFFHGIPRHTQTHRPYRFNQSNENFFLFICSRRTHAG